MKMYLLKKIQWSSKRLNGNRIVLLNCSNRHPHVIITLYCFHMEILSQILLSVTNRQMFFSITSKELGSIKNCVSIIEKQKTSFILPRGLFYEASATNKVMVLFIAL